MLLKIDCLPYAVGKQPSIPSINLGRKWTLNRWWWWDLIDFDKMFFTSYPGASFIAKEPCPSRSTFTSVPSYIAFSSIHAWRTKILALRAKWSLRTFYNGNKTDRNAVTKWKMFFENREKKVFSTVSKTMVHIDDTKINKAWLWNFIIWIQFQRWKRLEHRPDPVFKSLQVRIVTYLNESL